MKRIELLFMPYEGIVLPLNYITILLLGDSDGDRTRIFLIDSKVHYQFATEPKFGGKGWIRTTAAQVSRPPLYQLSYHFHFTSGGTSRNRTESLCSSGTCANHLRQSSIYYLVVNGWNRTP